MIRETHADNEFGDFVRMLRRDSYETISTAIVAANFIHAHGMNLSSDSTLGILTTPIYPVFLVQNRNLSDLSVASESDSLRLDIFRGQSNILRVRDIAFRPPPCDHFPDLFKRRH